MRINDYVYYISGRFGDNANFPLYNGTRGQVGGVIHEIDHENSCAFVSFHRHINWFNLSDLVLRNSICPTVPRYLALAKIALNKPRPIGYPTEGDAVVYVSGRYGNSSANPCWPLCGDATTEVGVLTRANDPALDYRCRVNWVVSNRSNTYLLDDLRAINDPVLKEIQHEITKWLLNSINPSPAPELILPERRIKGVFNV